MTAKYYDYSKTIEIDGNSNQINIALLMDKIAILAINKMAAEIVESLAVEDVKNIPGIQKESHDCKI